MSFKKVDEVNVIKKTNYRKLYHYQRKKINELNLELMNLHKQYNQLELFITSDQKDILNLINQTLNFDKNEYQDDKNDKEPLFISTCATNIINNKYKEKQQRDIWEDCIWKNISKLENDYVGRVGEEIIETICQKSQIVSIINGVKTKQLGGGIGDGKIKGRTCEIKTARLGNKGKTFQHELGEVPWKSEYMIFLDIAPKKMYITIFKNFPEKFYKKSALDKSIKCIPYFPTKSIIWRKQKGVFKLDTSIQINENNKYTFIIDENTNDYFKFKSFVDHIIP